MKKIFLSLFIIVLTNSISFSQENNFSQFTVGFSLGVPRGDKTKSLNKNLTKFNIGQEFALNKYFSLSLLGNLASTKGKSLNPDIDKIGVGGGFKLQLIPIIEALLKKDSISRFNYFLAGSGLINVNNISNYAKSGQMTDINVIIGLEFINKYKRTFKIFYGANYLNNNLTSNSSSSDSRLFNQIGISVGFKNLSKK